MLFNPCPTDTLTSRLAVLFNPCLIHTLTSIVPVQPTGKVDGGDDNPQLLVDLHDAKSSELRYTAKLTKLNETRKWTAEDVCEVAEDFTAVSPPGLKLSVAKKHSENQFSWMFSIDFSWKPLARS